jgi:5-methylcytosine-specific restriction enzyme A
MRNPKWHRDEIILALDLYFSPNRGSIDAKNSKIIELSRILNGLPLFQDRPDPEKFRNPNGVTLKLSNFLAIDTDYRGQGMDRGSKLDKIIFDEYTEKRELLHAVASEIRKITSSADLKSKVFLIEDDEVDEGDFVLEGRILYKLHKLRERNRKIVAKKKKWAINKFGKLGCEVCGLVFEEYYGEIGKGYIECHHRIPLSKFSINTKTTINDLALVCSNCHRMLHKKIDSLSVEDLKATIQRHK